MPRAHRVTLIAAVLPLTLALAGCETSGFWDSANSVSDRFQDALADFSPFGTAKKPLPGERRAVFPEGVPGVQQGVPRELMRGNQQAEEPQAQPEPQPAAAAKGKTKKAAATTAKTPARARPAATSSDPPEDGVWPPPPTR
jgi:hypothetical protein